MSCLSCHRRVRKRGTVISGNGWSGETYTNKPGISSWCWRKRGERQLLSARTAVNRAGRAWTSWNAQTLGFPKWGHGLVGSTRLGSLCMQFFSTARLGLLAIVYLTVSLQSPPASLPSYRPPPHGHFYTQYGSSRFFGKGHLPPGVRAPAGSPRFLRWSCLSLSAGQSLRGWLLLGHTPSYWAVQGQLWAVSFLFFLTFRTFYLFPLKKQEGH